MPAFIRHLFAGGWATDFGPNSDLVPETVGDVAAIGLPFLYDAENAVYELDGGPHKCPGTTKLNSSALESGAEVMGVFDAWFQGTTGSPTQHRIVHVSTTIKEDDADGSFSDLFTGMTDEAVPSYAMLSDLLVIANDANDAVKSWDGSTAQSLGGSPPTVGFLEVHKNHMFGAGDVTNPSRLYYVTAANLGSGAWSNIDVSPDDGDKITGIISWRGELWIFKGPYKGSIHRLTGSSSSDFALTNFIRGVGAVANNAIFTFQSDVGFLWSDGSIRTLRATQDFGDAREAALSFPIHRWIREHVAFSQLHKAHAAVSDDSGIVLFALPIDGGSKPNTILMMDFRFNPVRWAWWPDFDFVTSLASVVDSASSNRRVIFAGCNDGFVRKLEQATRSIDGDTAITYKVTTPVLTYGSPHLKKTLMHIAVGFQPKNDGSVTFGWTRDNMAQQTLTLTQGGADVLGTASANQFTLGTSTLGGAYFVDRFQDTVTGGEFRSIQYQVTHAVNNEDVEIHSISAETEDAAGQSFEN